MNIRNKESQHTRSCNEKLSVKKLIECIFEFLFDISFFIQLKMQTFKREHFLKLIYYPLKLSQINKRLFRNGCPTNVRLCLNQLHFQFVQTSMIYKRPWLSMPLDIIQQWQRLQYSDWTRKAWVPWMRKFGLTAYQLSYKELHKLPFRPKRQLFYLKKKKNV